MKKIGMILFVAFIWLGFTANAATVIVDDAITDQVQLTEQTADLEYGCPPDCKKACCNKSKKECPPDCKKECCKKGKHKGEEKGKKKGHSKEEEKEEDVKKEGTQDEQEEKKE